MTAGPRWRSSTPGRATLEIANPAQKAMIDEVEVGRPVAPHIRLAFEVGDGRTVTDALVEAGAELIAPPTVTPWNSLNSRLAGPADLQLTVFQELANAGDAGDRLSVGFAPFLDAVRFRSRGIRPT